MKLERLLFRSNGVSCPKELLSKEITAICHRPEGVKEGTLYAALEKKSGADMQSASEAAMRGAVVLRPRDSGDFVWQSVTSDNVRSAYSYAASAFYDYPCEHMKTVAVTGTNGKTTVSSLTAFLLEAQGIKTGLIGTLGIYSGGVKIDEEKLAGTEANMTTPDPDRFFSALDIMRRDGCSSAVFEASSHALALSKLDGARCDVSVFTNLTEDHLDFHGDLESYFGAKRKIVSLSDVTAVNADDPYASRLLANESVVGISCLKNGKNIYSYAENIDFKGLCGIEYTAVINGRKYKVSTPMFGSFQVFNTLAALTAVSVLGNDVESACRSISSFSGASGRCERVVCRKGLPSVIIDYAHTPDALEKTLQSLKEVVGKGRLIALFGCGGDREKAKRPLMGRAACILADHTFLTEDNSRSEDRLSIISDIEKGFFKSTYTVVPDRAEAIMCALEYANDDDVVVLCGKGHENYIIDKSGKRYFSDAETARKAAVEISERRQM